MLGEARSWSLQVTLRVACRLPSYPEKLRVMLDSRVAVMDEA